MLAGSEIAAHPTGGNTVNAGSATSDAIRNAVEGSKVAPSLESASRCLSALEQRFGRAEVTAEEVTAVADALHEPALLGALSTPELKLLCERIAETNSRDLPVRIAAGPVLSFARRPDSVPSDIALVAHGHLVSTRPESPPPSDIPAALAAIPSDKDHGESALTALLSVARYISVADNRDRPPFSAYLGAVPTGAAENLRDSLRNLKSAFPDDMEDFLSCWLDVHSILIERTDARYAAPFYSMWIGHLHELLADERENTTYESEERLIALDTYLECLGDPRFPPLGAAQMEFVTTRLIRLSIELARSSPRLFYRDCAFMGLYAAMNYETANCPQLELELAQELRHIPFPVRAPEVDTPDIRGVDSRDVLDGLADLTMVMPDTALSGATFHVSAYLSGEVDESAIDVSVTADHPTVVLQGGAGDIRRTGSMFTATLLASHGDYVGRIYVSLLAANQPVGLMTHDVVFRAPGSGVAPHLDHRSLTRLEPAEADLHLFAMRDRGSFVVDLLEAADSRPERVVTIHIDTEPTTFVAHAFGEIRAAWARMLDPSGQFRNEYDYLTRTLDALADTLSDSLLRGRLPEALPRIGGNPPTVAIATNEPSIPWEILPTSRRPDRSFLAAECAVTIMPFVGTVPREFPLGSIKVFVRGSGGGSSVTSSPQFESEIFDVFGSRSGATHPVEPFAMDRDSLLSEWRSSAGNLWYIASHGIFDEDARRLLIETDDERDRSIRNRPDGIRLSDLCGGNVPKGAFLFFNGCNTAIEEFGLFRRQSWPQRLLELGIAGFLGTRWPVTDRSATLFARIFFEELTQGGTIPECVRIARCAVRKKYGDHDISWAAYTLFCHPQLRAVKSG
ncbi:CHAT domain-containing protein [Nocardia sp. NPDC003345]